jgi:gliding motility-associated transport system permease protein
MNLFTIWRKELNSYFRSPIAYGVLGFFALISGYFFYAATVYFIQNSLQSTMMGQSVPLDVDEIVIKSVLGNISVIGLFLIPLISMRLFAEEKRSGTIELLVTSPLRDWEVIMGKWLAAMTLWVAMLGLSALNMVILFAYGNPDWHPMAVGYLGLFLQGGCLLAIGTFISTCTKNQIVAGVATFGVCLMLWVLDWVTSFEASPFLTVLSYLSVTTHFDTFSRGVIDSKDVIYYVSLILFGLFLTGRSLESMRWRA